MERSKSDDHLYRTVSVGKNRYSFLVHLDHETLYRGVDKFYNPSNELLANILLEQNPAVRKSKLETLKNEVTSALGPLPYARSGLYKKINAEIRKAENDLNPRACFNK